MVNGVYESHIATIKDKTLAEIAAAADATDVYYIATGTIKEIADEKWGNLWLSDGTTDLYVYGCYPGWGATGDNRHNQIANAGIKVGDKLSVIGIKSTFNDAPQIKNGIYFSHEAGEPGGGSITVDGNAADWEGIQGVASADCPAGAELGGIKSAKAYYGDKLYILAEFSDEALAKGVADGKLRFHVYVGADGGLLSHKWEDANIAYMLEGKATSGGSYTDFSSPWYKFTGAAATDWAWENSGVTPAITSAGNGNVYEVAIDYSDFPGGFPEQVEIGIDCADGDYAVTGYAPQTAHKFILKKGEVVTPGDTTDNFDYTPGSEYSASNNLWKPVDANKAQRYFYSVNPDWAGQIYAGSGKDCPYLEFNQSTYKLTFETATTGRWQNQFFVHPDEGSFIPIDAAKTYKFSVTAQSTKAFDAFFKLVAYDGSKDNREGGTLWEPGGDSVPSNVFFEANKPITLETEFSGLSAENINVFFDLGGNPANTVVYIKDITITEVGGGSEPVNISVDGDFSDWAAVSGGLNSEEGPYLVCKAVNDDNYLYIYSKRTWHDGLWKDSSGGYYYYEFDTDNDESTGTNDVNGNSGYGVEAWMYLYLFTGSASAPTFASSPKGSGYPSSSVINDVLAAGKTDMSIIETEVRIPLSNISVTKGQTIRIYTWGNKSASNFKNAKESILMTLK